MLGIQFVHRREAWRCAEGEEAQPSMSQNLTVATTGGASTPTASNGDAVGSPVKAAADAASADATTPVAATPDPAPADAKPVAAHVVVLSDDENGGDGDGDGDTAESAAGEIAAVQAAAFELDVGADGDNGTAAATGGAFAETAAAAGASTPGPRTPALGERSPSFQFSRQSSVLMRAGSSVGGTALAAQRERVRTPAWTDRILFRCESDRLHQLLYDRAEGIALSDHKAVSAAFLLDAVRLDEVRMRRETDAAQRSLDAAVNSTQPRCELAENLLDVGELTYGEVAERRSTLSCCGEVRDHTVRLLPAAAPQSPIRNMTCDGIHCAIFNAEVRAGAGRVGPQLPTDRQRWQ